ncbi:MAG: hypothetical protein L6Q99_01080 [Planctomycetes bacterium]|nr:hypothetical protein [Planctomycetota bacterium]
MTTKKSPSTHIRREEELVHALSQFLVSTGYRVRHEVPNMGQSADLVATRGRWVTFVEAKMRDWRRALEQCRAHEQVADFVCIALLGARPSAELVREVESSGYGLVLVSPVDGECRWITTPARNRSVWQPQRRMLSESLRLIRHVD